MDFALTASSGYWTTLRPDDPFPRHLDCSARLESLGDDLWECPACGLTGGLLTPSNPNESSNYERSVLEAASWRLASQLTRRNSKLRIHRAFPHPGTSDVLVVAPSFITSSNEPGPILFLDRDHGRIHLLQRADGLPVEGGPWRWDEYLMMDTAPLLEKIEHAAGLSPADDVSDPSIEATMYGLVADLAALAVFAEPMRISGGYEDGEGQADWWADMQSRAPEETQAKPGERGAPGTRFWRIERSDFLLTIEISTGGAWAGDYDREEVETQGYDEGAHRLTEFSWQDSTEALETALELGRL